MLIGKAALELLSAEMRPAWSHGRCARRRFSAARCGKCVEVCLHAEKAPAGQGLPAGQGCTGCGLCAAACPTGALGGPVGQELESALATLAQRHRPVLGCRELAADGAHARTACLGFLGSEHLLALRALFPAGLTLNLSRCAGCRNGFIVPVLKELLARLQAIPGVSALGPLHLAEQDSPGCDEPGVTRREFFTWFRKKSTIAAADRLERLLGPPAAKPAREKGLPAGRALLLKTLPAFSPALRRNLEGRLFPEPCFGAACIACTGCVGMCPTGALQPSAKPKTPPRAFSPRCTGCRLCTAFCSRGGLSLRTS